MSGFRVEQPGLLTLIQDAGRFGQHRIGLTNGGPLDASAFNWANKLCGNTANTTALEISIGGLVLIAETDTYIAVTGANMPLTINTLPAELWRTHKVKAGDKIAFGFATSGARAYLAIRDGFDIPHSFTSAATVTREAVGGLAGTKLQKGDALPCVTCASLNLFALPTPEIPEYSDVISLRVILGYQHKSFSKVQQQLFFSSQYTVTDKIDRMGFRLKGQAVKSSLEGILSEGICHGAIQIPADGQPIVLMNDRQTIGGYPKIGSVIALDTAKLSQLMPNSPVHFEQISLEDAHNINHLAKQRHASIKLIQIS